MQNYYIRIEDMPSLVSHQLSIIKYVVLKKIFFFLCFDPSHLDLDSNLFGLGLTRTRTSLDLDLSWTRQRWDLTTALVCFLSPEIHHQLFGLVDVE